MVLKLFQAWEGKNNLKLKHNSSCFFFKFVFSGTPIQPTWLPSPRTFFLANKFFISCLFHSFVSKYQFDDSFWPQLPWQHELHTLGSTELWQPQSFISHDHVTTVFLTFELALIIYHFLEKHIHLLIDLFLLVPIFTIRLLSF